MKVLTIKNTFAVSTVLTGILFKFVLHRYFGVLSFEATTAFSLTNGSLANSLYGVIVPLVALAFIGVSASNETTYCLFSFAGIKADVRIVNPAIIRKTELVCLRR